MNRAKRIATIPIMLAIGIVVSGVLLVTLASADQVTFTRQDTAQGVVTQVYDDQTGQVETFLNGAPQGTRTATEREIKGAQGLLRQQERQAGAVELALQIAAMKSRPSLVPDILRLETALIAIYEQGQ